MAGRKKLVYGFSAFFTLIAVPAFNNLEIKYFNMRETKRDNKFGLCLIYFIIQGVPLLC